MRSSPRHDDQFLQDSLKPLYYDKILDLVIGASLSEPHTSARTFYQSGFHSLRPAGMSLRMRRFNLVCSLEIIVC